jgi:hypothetical protein
MADSSHHSNYNGHFPRSVSNSGVFSTSVFGHFICHYTGVVILIFDSGDKLSEQNPDSLE